MKPYFIKSSCLIVNLTSQLHLALLHPTEVKEGTVFRLDLNQLPPDEASITPARSTSSTGSLYGSRAGLHLPREQPMATMPHSSMSPKAVVDVFRGDHASPGVEVKSDWRLSKSDHFTSSHKRKSEDAYSEQKTHKFHCDVGGERQSTSPDIREGKTCKNIRPIFTGFLAPNQPQIGRPTEEPMETFRETFDIPKDKIEVKQEVGEVFDAYDWSFVKVDPEPEDLNENQKKVENLKHEQKLFEHLNGMRSKPTPEKGFWIPRGDDQRIFFRNYHKQKNNLIYPREIVYFHRKVAVLHIIGRISREKLDLDQYFGFFSELEKHLRLNLKSNKGSFVRSNDLENPLSTRIEYMKKLTRVTTTLSILYLFLFREQAYQMGGTFTTKIHIINFINFLKEFWENILNLNHNNEEFFHNNRFANQLHEVLNFRAKKNINDSQMSNAAEVMQMSWHILAYWLQKIGKGSPIQSQKIPNHKSIVEIIHKIIFWLNFKTICQMLKCTELYYLN
ncbi:hypothetical protein PGT21_026714 [Puccinia graminis f. sp. tritici]|uniref:Uncharacterized protein n=1 Tax=Puccinia graminis f. sp. tritici TaxID=56615 RepID=A0A5B0MNG1_PUCGR|nr:hypothetical protein PGT21_026714 [Puccinia graminis f. sp. tritici]